MRKIIIILLLILVVVIMGAEFKVTGDLEKETTTFIKNNVKDADGLYCSRIQINSDIRNLKFDSNRKPVDIRLETGKYFVFLSPGERSLTFLHDDFAAFEYEFPLTLRANTAYVMTVVRSGYGSADEGLVTITFELNEKDVYIAKDDNPPILNKQKSAQYKLLPGIYTFSFIKQGFAEKEQDIKVEKDELITINLEEGQSSHLMKLPGIVIIDSEPQGADIYLNDQKVGVTLWQDELIAGDYMLTIKANMYHSKTQEFSLGEGQTLELPKIKLVPKHGFWEVNCDQTKANIYLDGMLVGNGSIARQRIESGNHLLSVKLDYYHDREEEFLINDGDEKSFEIEMKPAYGQLEIESTPVDGANVYINGELAGRTPYLDDRRLSGQYRIKVEKELYVGAEEIVEVSDEELTTKTILLTQNFGVLNVQSEGSDIYVNDEAVGKSSYKANLSAGNYQVEAKKDRHRSASKDVYLGVGTEEQVILEPEPIMGSLSVLSNPPKSKGAAIWVNGEKEKKTTPAVLPLLIGNYSIKVHHPDFLEQSKQVNIKEGSKEKLIFDLETYRGSMLSKRNVWKRNGWIGMGATFLVIGAGFFFNGQGDGYADDYTSGTDTDVSDIWDDMESSYQMRDYCYYFSAVPAIYTVYSWIRTGHYSGKLKK